MNLKNREIKIGEISIKLQPIHLALYATFLKLKTKCSKKQCYGCEKCHITRKVWSDDAKNVFSKIYNKLRIDGQSWFSDLDPKKNKYSSEKFTSAISKINKTIKSALKNDTLAAYYMVISKRQYGCSKYTVKIGKNKIKFVG